MDERSLYNLKWFDYRPIEPDTATLACAMAHTRKLGTYLQELDCGNFISARNSLFKGFNLDKIRGWKHFETMERLRWWCDKRLLRYDLFWEYAFETYIQFGLGTRGYGKGRRHRMIFLSLFRSQALLAHVAQLHQGRSQERIALSDHPYFAASQWRGELLQRDYADYLVNELRRRHGSGFEEKVEILIENGRLHRDAYLAARASFRMAVA